MNFSDAALLIPQWLRKFKIYSDLRNTKIPIPK
jgi:hypothetical protein